MISKPNLSLPLWRGDSGQQWNGGYSRGYAKHHNSNTSYNTSISFCLYLFFLQCLQVPSSPERVKDGRMLLHLLSFPKHLDLYETIHCWRVVLPSSLFPHDTLFPQMDLACCRESIQRNADEREVSGFGSHWVAQGSWKILHSLNVGIHHAPHTIGDFF
ncbi:hypothetical protein F2Q69_00037932 [Brassica cretica]|uniref:Uncharacterized protein n=1 Tax=Brassica cretica TaxID=69181 RepID=A0A8S9SQE9_BRACR|nr:hypothetical protein F2Q69_00037932 [Brassica cretica]